ncbi:MAG: AMP-binding protein [Deltaproteobacteria bacterium]|nr:AMP-binding protein [Deltaproteobacteria bacterium]
MNLELEKNIIQRVALGDIFRRRAAHTPDRVALRDYKTGIQQTVTFKELNQAMNRFASAARSSGLEKGGRIALLGLNSAEYVISLYGSAKAGLTAVPINPGIAAEDLIYVLNHSGASCLVADSLLAPLVDRIRDRVPGIRQVIIIPTGSEPVSENAVLFDDFLGQGSPGEILDTVIQERDIFEILYTSGTTGRPKGVLVTHLGVYISALSTAIEFGLRPGYNSTMMLPMFHCAQQAVTLSTLNVGGSVSIIRQFDPGNVMDIVENDRLNLMFGLPVMYRAMIHHPRILEHKWNDLKTCVFAMAPMDQATLQKGMDIFQAEFMLGTGQTECFPPTNVFRASQHLDKQGNYWGESNMAVDTVVMDDAGNLLEQGQVGEIVWRGPVVMAGYYKDEEASAKSRQFGWHHSGDLGAFDRDGQLLFVDRKKDMIKTGGENVASIKVERVILGDSRVEQVAVVGLPDERWTEAVTAFVVPVKGSNVTEEDIIGLCKGELGKFEVPKQVIFMESLPLTPTGKIRKNVLRENGESLKMLTIQREHYHGCD